MRKSVDFYIVKYVKDENQKDLVRDEEFKKKWRDYLDRLCNGSFTQD